MHETEKKRKEKECKRKERKERKGRKGKKGKERSKVTESVRDSVAPDERWSHLPHVPCGEDFIR